MKSERFTALALAVIVVLAVVGCPGQPGPSQTGAAPPVATKPAASDSGTIRVSGAFALYPMVVKWAEEYKKLHPGVNIDVSPGGAGKGATDALGGLVQIGMISRAIKPEEEQKGGWWIPVCRDAVFSVVNEKNPVLDKLLAHGMKKDALVGLWMTGKITTWGAVVGSGNTDKINVYTRSDSCGAAEVWSKFLGGKAQDDLKGIGVNGDPGLAEAVRKDPQGIGFNNLNYAYDAQSGKPVAGLQIVPLDLNGNGKLEDKEKFYEAKSDVVKAVQDGRYPSPPARDENFLCKGAPTGLTRDFIKWCLSDGQKYVLETGFIPLTSDKLGKALAQVK
jgi:phosphate transport system substrate-binding protein